MPNKTKSFWSWPVTTESLGSLKPTIKKEKKTKEKERQKEEKRKAREERVVVSEPSGGSLTGKIARLKKLYNNGTLTKAEFEQAKNKLLK